MHRAVTSEAQGGATLGAPALVQGTPIAAAQGVVLAAATFAMLAGRQQRNLAGAHAQCNSFIVARPPAGFLGKRSFYGLSRDNNRFDVDSFGISPNFVV